MGSTIFLDKHILEPGYMLKDLSQLLYRQKQIKEFCYHLGWMVRNGCEHLIIKGNEGSGKTTINNLVLNLAKEYATEENVNLHVIYIDCNQHKSEYTVLKYIVNHLPNGSAENKCLNHTTDFRLTISRFLEKDSVNLIIVLDNAEQLTTLDPLIFLVRIGEYKGYIRPSTICITNAFIFGISDKDAGFNSRYTPSKIDMEYYEIPQVTEIISRRIKLAFIPDAVPEEVIECLVGEIDKHTRNLNEAFMFLRQAGELADSKNQPQITVEDMKTVIHKKYYEKEDQIGNYNI